MCDNSHAWLGFQIDDHCYAIDPTTSLDETYKLKTQDDISRFENKNANVEHSDASNTPVVNFFLNDRLFDINLYHIISTIQQTKSNTA